jgi:hypothetical protein
VEVARNRFGPAWMAATAKILKLSWGGVEGQRKFKKSSGYRGFKGIGAERVHGKCRFSVNNESWKLIFGSN